MTEGVTMETLPKRVTSFDASDAARHYADRLSQIDHVERVVLEETLWEGRRLWAVIDAPPFEAKYRDPIYETQGQIIDELEEAVFDFRVVNVNELASPLETVLPAQARILYERPTRG